MNRNIWGQLLKSLTTRTCTKSYDPYLIFYYIFTRGLTYICTKFIVVTILHTMAWNAFQMWQIYPLSSIVANQTTLVQRNNSESLFKIIMKSENRPAQLNGVFGKLSYDNTAMHPSTKRWSIFRSNKSIMDGLHILAQIHYSLQFT